MNKIFVGVRNTYDRYRCLGKKRDSGIVCILILLFSTILSGCSQKTPKIYRVGILSGANSLLDTITGFKARMTQLGYIEGQNILYDLHKTDNDPTEEQRIINRFIDEKVDLIFAFPNETAIIAKVVTQNTDIPVVFAYSGIEGTSLVRTQRQPGGNITGVRYPIQDLSIKRLELLLEFDPRIKRIWVSYDPSFPLIPNALLALRPAADARGITLIEVPVSSAEEVKEALRARENMTEIGIDAIMIMPDLVTQSVSGWNSINQFANMHKLPISAIFYNQVHKGALFHYGLNYVEVGKQAASIADNILQGVPPSEIPVVSPEGYLSINLQVAERLGLDAPAGLLKQATEIIR